KEQIDSQSQLRLDAAVTEQRGKGGNRTPAPPTPIIEVASSPVTPLPLLPSEPYSATQPVVYCSQVKIYLNPRCKGAETLNLLLAGGLWSSRLLPLGAGIDFRRAFRPGAAEWIPYIRPRLDVEYSYLG